MEKSGMFIEKDIIICGKHKYLAIQDANITDMEYNVVGIDLWR